MNNIGFILHDLRKLRRALVRVIEASPAYRHPIGSPNSLARVIQNEQIVAEDEANAVLKSTEFYDDSPH